MARLTKSERLARVHERALAHYSDVASVYYEERQQCLQDRRFYSIAGAQWEGSFGDQFENRPRLEINKVHLGVMRIINEYRNNRVTVDFRSKDGSDDSEADTLDGLFRADMQDSGGEEAFDNAFEEGAGGGFGAIRLRACLDDEDDDENDCQRIRIEPIYDADTSVYFDVDAKRQDKADARYAYVLYSMTHDAYLREWGHDPASIGKVCSGQVFDWYTPSIVFVAEYYEVEEKKERFHVYRDAMDNEETYSADELDEDDGKLAETLEAAGWFEVRSYTRKSKRVHKYIMDGARILEDCGYIAGKCIPIAPFYGKRWFVDNVERCMGHVRLLKDAQRLKNIQTSAMVEMAAQPSVEKPIFLPEQMAGYQQMWANDGVENYPYLLVNPIRNADGSTQPAGAVGYTKPPSIPPVMAGLIQLSDADMQDLLGGQQAGEKMVSNISGKAVEMIQSRLDMQAFIYMSNFAKTVRRVGEIWLSMARDVYTEEGRRMKTVGVQGETDGIVLMEPAIDERTGAEIVRHDLSKVKYDVSVDVGPSFNSRRDATVRALTGMLQAITDPNDAKVLQGTILQNLDGEGLEDIRAYFRKQMVSMGVVKPTEEEQMEIQKAAEAASQQPPSPEAAYLEKLGNKEEALAAKARTDTLEAMADIEKTRAETAKILSDISLEELRAALEAREALAAPQNPTQGEMLASEGQPGSPVVMSEFEAFE